MPSMTITTTAENAADLAAAVGWKLGLQGSASAAQVKAYAISELKAVNRQHKEWLNELAKPPITDIEPT